MIELIPWWLPTCLLGLQSFFCFVVVFYNFALLSSFPANGLWSKGSIELSHFLRGIFSTEPPWKRDGGNVFDLGYAYAGSMFLTLGKASPCNIICFLM